MFSTSARGWAAQGLFRAAAQEVSRCIVSIPLMLLPVSGR